MKRYKVSRTPLAGVSLVAAAVFIASCAQAEVAKPMPANAAAVVLTQIKTEAGSCDPAFENNNCGGSGNPGDICIKPGSPVDPTQVLLKFVVAGPGANSAELEKMTIGTGADWSCPPDVQDDFPDFAADCTFTPASPGNAMQVRNENLIARTWNYSITLIPRAGCPSTTIHPIIDNGGGNSSSDDEDP